jgi:hypothetical protein
MPSAMAWPRRPCFWWLGGRAPATSPTGPASPCRQASLSLWGWLGLSIAGAPFLLGHGAKTLLFSTPLAGFAGLSAPTAAWLLPLLSVGTAAVYARILWVPIRSGPQAQAPGALLLALLLLWPLWLIPLGSSPLALPSPAASLAKTLAVLAAGAGVEALRRALAGLRLPGVPLPDLERLVDLLGGMAVVGAGVLLACLGLELPLGVEAEVVAWRG